MNDIPQDLDQPTGQKTAEDGLKKSENDAKMSDSPANSKNKIFNRELLIRSVSAVILGFTAIYLTAHSFYAFGGFCAVVLLLMIWEWGRLTNNDTAIQLSIHVVTLTIAITAFLIKDWALFFVIVCAGCCLATWSTQYWWRSKWSLLGLAYVGLPILSLLYLRSDPNMGFYAILYVFFIVWGTDTAAYFTGRHFGGKKLAPSISPGKSWSGAFGGLFAGFIIGALFAISIEQSPVIPALIGLFLSAISQVGDLVESAVKRHFGVKDSGNIIPGHGGILDRFDGVIFAACGAALIALIHDFNRPGEALLIWFP